MNLRVPVRKPAVRGTFYPADAGELCRMAGRFLQAASERILPGRPSALVVPHAGYAFSGPIAGSGFVQLIRHAADVHRVILLGPSHYQDFEGLAACDEDAFETPMGMVHVDRNYVHKLEARQQVRIDSHLHQHEHCLEVQLPFLQFILHDFRIVPLVTGRARSWEIADLLEESAHDPNCLILVSTDLSHYFTYRKAHHMDRLTRLAIENLDESALTGESACGRTALAGLICLARRLGWEGRCLDLRNSGDICGNHRQVVGYGAWAFYEPGQERLNEGLPEN